MHAHDNADLRSAHQATVEEADGAGVVSFSLLVTVTVRNRQHRRRRYRNHGPAGGQFRPGHHCGRAGCARSPVPALPGARRPGRGVRRRARRRPRPCPICPSSHTSPANTSEEAPMRLRTNPEAACAAGASPAAGDEERHPRLGRRVNRVRAGTAGMARHDPPGVRAVPVVLTRPATPVRGTDRAASTLTLGDLLRPRQLVPGQPDRQPLGADHRQTRAGKINAVQQDHARPRRAGIRAADPRRHQTRLRRAHHPTRRRSPHRGSLRRRRAEPLRPRWDGRGRGPHGRRRRRHPARRGGRPGHRVHRRAGRAGPQRQGRGLRGSSDRGLPAAALRPRRGRGAAAQPNSRSCSRNAPPPCGRWSSTAASTPATTN